VIRSLQSLLLALAIAGAMNVAADPAPVDLPRIGEPADVALSPAEASAAAAAFKSIADSDGDGRITPIEYRQARDFILARY